MRPRRTESELRKRAHRKRLANDEALKAAVYAKTDGRCWYCGSPFDERHHLREIDHIVAVHYGGENVIENLVPACHMCNATKGNRGAEYLRARLACIAIMEAYEAGRDISGVYHFAFEGGA